MSSVRSVAVTQFRKPRKLKKRLKGSGLEISKTYVTRFLSNSNEN